MGEYDLIVHMFAIFDEAVISFFGSWPRGEKDDK